MDNPTASESTCISCGGPVDESKGEFMCAECQKHMDDHRRKKAVVETKEG